MTDPDLRQRLDNARRCLLAETRTRIRVNNALARIDGLEEACHLYSDPHMEGMRDAYDHAARILREALDDKGGSE